MHNVPRSGVHCACTWGTLCILHHGCIHYRVYSLAQCMHIYSVDLIYSLAQCMFIYSVDLLYSLAQCMFTYSVECRSTLIEYIGAEVHIKLKTLGFSSSTTRQDRVSEFKFDISKGIFSNVIFVWIRVRSDKYRTGIITIVPVRTATVNLKYR